MTDDDNEFGEVFYEYTVQQAIEDGSLIKADFLLDDQIKNGKLKLGMIVITPGIHELIGDNEDDWEGVIGCLRWHAHGNWGTTSQADKKLNDQALKNGERILSAYRVKDPAFKTTYRDIWIITEADRATTTILLPSEY